MEGGVSTLSSVALMCGYISPNAHRIWMFAICPFKPMLDLPHLFCFIPESTAVNKLHQPHQSNLQKRSGVNSCVSSLSSLPHSVSCGFYKVLNNSLFRYCVRHQQQNVHKTTVPPYTPYNLLTQFVLILPWSLFFHTQEQMGTFSLTDLFYIERHETG